jgi:predicted DNA-binding transcriptional regulator AlpA
MTYSSKLQIFGVPIASLLKARAKNGAEEASNSHTPLPQNPAKKQSRLLTFNELKTLKGIDDTRQNIHRLEKANKFPQRIKMGARVYWYEHEIDGYVQRHADARQRNID